MAIASEIAERINETDLGKCAEASLKGDVVIVAAPVFSGRIPALVRIESGECGAVSVPGNRPYREGGKSGATPIALPDCRGCGHCASVCPTEAIRILDEAPVTDSEKCIMCMACVAKCHSRSRVLPTEVLNGLTERFGVFRDVQRENEFF